MRISTLIEQKGATPDVLERDLRKIIRQAMHESIQAWHRRILPRHFERGALNRYSRAYRARKPTYERRKQRQHGHRRPLVFSGRMRRQLMQTIRVTGTFRKSGGTMQSPDYLRKRPRGSSQIDKRREILVTTLSEERELAKIFETVFDRLIHQRNGKRRRRRVR